MNITNSRSVTVDRDALIRALDGLRPTIQSQIVQAVNAWVSTWERWRYKAESMYDCLEEGLRRHEMGRNPQTTLVTQARDLDELSVRLDERLDALKTLCYTVDLFGGREFSKLFDRVWDTVTVCRVEEDK